MLTRAKKPRGTTKKIPIKKVTKLVTILFVMLTSQAIVARGPRGLRALVVVARLEMLRKKCETRWLIGESQMTAMMPSTRSLDRSHSLVTCDAVCGGSSLGFGAYRGGTLVLSWSKAPEEPDAMSSRISCISASVNVCASSSEAERTSLMVIGV